MSDHFRLTTHALGGVARDVSIRQPREGENPAHVAVSAYEYTMRNAQPGTQVTLYRNGQRERQITIRERGNPMSVELQAYTVRAVHLGDGTRAHTRDVVPPRVYRATSPDEACTMAERADAGRVGGVDWYFADPLEEGK